MRDEYEIQLLELRQGLKEEEEGLRNLECIPISKFRSLLKLRALVQKELLSYRQGFQKTLDLNSITGG